MRTDINEATVLPSQNHEFGFWGTITNQGLKFSAVAREWERASIALQRRGMTPEQAREYLDSTSGRHLADAWGEGGMKRPGYLDANHVNQWLTSEGKEEDMDIIKKLTEDYDLGVCKDCGASEEMHPGDGVLVCKKYVEIPSHDFTLTMQKNFKDTGTTNILGTKNEGKMKDAVEGKFDKLITKLVEDEEGEPEEDDITTEDHQHWYMSGRLYFTGSPAQLRARMEQDGYWPNCWFISDHGNAHLIRDFSEAKIKEAGDPNDVYYDAGPLHDRMDGHEARFIAQNWHASMSDPLYAFSSSGHFDGPGLESSIRAAMRGPFGDDEDEVEIGALLAYVQNRRRATNEAVSTGRGMEVAQFGYTLVIKGRGEECEEALVRHFPIGTPGVTSRFVTASANDCTYALYSKWDETNTLNKWMSEDQHLSAPYPVGSLLYWHSKTNEAKMNEWEKAAFIPPVNTTTLTLRPTPDCPQCGWKEGFILPDGTIKCGDCAAHFDPKSRVVYSDRFRQGEAKGLTGRLLREDYKPDTGNGEIALGLYLQKVGMDAQGNYSVWVAKGSNRAKKIQTNGNAPAAHHKDRQQILADPVASKEIADYFHKFLEADEPEKPYTPPVHYCDQCGKDMGNEWILGPVCGKCVRKNHAAATGGRVRKGRVTYEASNPNFVPNSTNGKCKSCGFEGLVRSKEGQGKLCIDCYSKKPKTEGASQAGWKPAKGTGYCDCTDRGCPAHKGANNCNQKATMTVYRIDMNDPSGTDMCDACAQDALESGVFGLGKGWSEAKGKKLREYQDESGLTCDECGTTEGVRMRLGPTGEDMLGDFCASCWAKIGPSLTAKNAEAKGQKHDTSKAINEAKLVVSEAFYIHVHPEDMYTPERGWHTPDVPTGKWVMSHSSLPDPRNGGGQMLMVGTKDEVMKAAQNTAITGKAELKVWDKVGESTIKEATTGFHVMTYGGGAYTAVGWYATQEEAQKEVDRLKASGAWSGMPPKIEAGRAFPGWGESKVKESVDDDLNELELYARNTYELYGQFQSIIANIKRRIKNHTYDTTLAPKLWMYWVDAASKRYTQEISGQPKGHTFAKSTREELAAQIAKDEYDAIMSGEYGAI